MPVLSMTEVSWDDTHVHGNRMLSNGQDMSGMRHHNHHHTSAARSQDDATVGYFYQRPQNDGGQPYNSKRWAVGDDSVIEQVRAGVTTVAELERDFQQMGFEREIGPTAKKIWDDDKVHKGIFGAGNPWTPRDDTWGTPEAREHAVSQPISMVQRRPGSFPGSEHNSVLSPRSSETGALGVNMVEYVLGGSPTGKELRMKFGGGGDAGQKGVDKNKNVQYVDVDKDHTGGQQEGGDVGQANGIMQNGLEDDKAFSRTPGSRQNSPTDDEQKVQQMHVEHVKVSRGEELLEQQQVLQHSSGLHLDAPQFEPVGIDTIPFDYSSQIVPSMDSPSFGMDYNQQLIQRQQPIAVLTQQQYIAAAQQQQLGMYNTYTYDPIPQSVYATYTNPVNMHLQIS